MKLNILTIPALALAATAIVSCENSTNEFPDFDYQTVYFANQGVGRTLELGRDLEINTDLDNLHQVNIKAVMGGAYGNSRDRHIGIAVDNGLCDNLFFTEDFGGHKVIPMPDDYYTILADEIVIPSGKLDGGVKIQLTDKFFNDPLALSFNYVIPVKMTHTNDVDSILEGRPAVENPNRLVPGDWNVLPQDYVLYAMKYVNPYHAYYLRRGVDRITHGTEQTTIVRHQKYVERNEEVHTVTASLNDCEIDLSTSIDGDHVYKYRLRLAFDDNGACTVSSADPNMTVTGTGKYVVDGEKKSIGGKTRDGLYLDYTVNAPAWSVAVKDTLVMRNRGVTAEYPEFVVK
ncbi:MAG: DUF1735 domain-containing protein [Muribaculaceae bacterium]|nr:DUF1735 domain-containing protein [Muribaculaceae bacterium]